MARDNQLVMTSLCACFTTHSASTVHDAVYEGGLVFVALHKFVCCLYIILLLSYFIIILAVKCQAFDFLKPIMACTSF